MNKGDNRKLARTTDIRMRYAALGRMVRDRRRALGHSQEEAGRASSTSASTVSRIESDYYLHDNRGLDVETYAKFCTYLNVRLDQFVEGLPKAALDTITAVNAILMLDKSLSRRGLTALIEIIKVTYFNVNKKGVIPQ